MDRDVTAVQVDDIAGKRQANAGARDPGGVVGAVRITFDGTDRARISLPNGRVAELTRFRF